MSHASERGPGNRPALSRLVEIDLDEFADRCWGRAPLLSRGVGSFDDLFSADAVDELVADRGLRTPFARMAREGTVLSPSLFTGSGGVGAEVADQLDPAAVLQQLAAGATLVLQGLHRTWEPVAAFTRALVADLGHPVQVNAYVTPASSRGFDPHYDTHDVFVIQVAGAKRWRIHAPVHEHPLADQPWTDHRDAVARRGEGEPDIDAVLEPGDVLYLPRGWIHSAVAQSGTSIHLTMGVRATTRADLVRALLDQAGADPELRRPLPLGVDYTDPGSWSQDLAATRIAAGRLLAEAPAERVAARLRGGLVGAVRPAPVRPLATTALLDDLDADTLVGWRDGLLDRLEHGDGTVRVVLPGRTVALPDEAADAVVALRDGVVPAGRLPGLDASSSLVVTRRLLREGVIVPRPS